MEDAVYGLAGDNVRVNETIERCYEMPFLDYEITKVLPLMTVEEKFKLLQYIIKISKMKIVLHEACFVHEKKAKEKLLRHCAEEAERLNKPHRFAKTPWIIR